MLLSKITNSLSQIAIRRLNKHMWKFKIMNFFIRKGYWEFITGDEKGPPLP
jgi:hypothetical protein